MESNLLKAYWHFRISKTEGDICSSNLKIPAIVALRKAKEYVATGKKYYDLSPYQAFEKLSPSQNKERWIENPESFFRNAGFAHKIIRLSHNGWYVNEFQSEILQGVVYQLTAKRGKPRYIAGYAHSDGYGANVELEIIKDEKDAAHIADGLAERNAETAREHEEAWQMGCSYSIAVENAKAARDEYAQLNRERRLWRGKAESELICKTITEKLKSISRKYGKQMQAAKEFLDSAPRNQNLSERWLDGAGLKALPD